MQVFKSQFSGIFLGNPGISWPKVDKWLEEWGNDITNEVEIPPRRVFHGTICVLRLRFTVWVVGGRGGLGLRRCMWASVAYRLKRSESRFLRLGVLRKAFHGGIQRV